MPDWQLCDGYATVSRSIWFSCHLEKEVPTGTPQRVTLPQLSRGARELSDRRRLGARRDASLRVSRVGDVGSAGARPQSRRAVQSVQFRPVPGWIAASIACTPANDTPSRRRATSSRIRRRATPRGSCGRPPRSRVLGLPTTLEAVAVHGVEGVDAVDELVGRWVGRPTWCVYSPLRLRERGNAHTRWMSDRAYGSIASMIELRRASRRPREDLLEDLLIYPHGR